ncbi:GntR family transcriptional regulator [Nocardioides sp. Kera G14]|uniref:GntR family transcriptional regulator n=1 Tax=Nocardioides sp. Kera G14 TaxID=2884264 RepID=UPI001D105798|nr:GntR family transcriptional regulator [Nocardioides sp. Kera G14]UDY24771.1 GntR family transcriptional regulator [Nocardioides sp. Kera G14]
MTEAQLLGDAVYAQLVDRIFTGALAPGAPLSVPALAAELDVSRSPVRDSVQRLVAEGLAVSVPHAGARVIEVDDTVIAQVMTVRRLLDGLAAREATERATAAQAAELRRLVEKQATEIEAGADPLADARLDLEFHTAVRDLAANPTLSDALHRLDAKAHLHNSGLWADESSRSIALDEHRRIIDAIEIGDAEAAEAAAMAHVAAVLVRMRRQARNR